MLHVVLGFARGLRLESPSRLEPATHNLRRPTEPLEKAYQVLDKLQPSCKTSTRSKREETPCKSIAVSSPFLCLRLAS